MKITLIRKDEEQGTEALSLCDTDAFFEKVKTENKAGHISELREILPRPGRIVRPLRPHRQTAACLSCRRIYPQTKG